jgi:hypothetical protein
MPSRVATFLLGCGFVILVILAWGAPLPVQGRQGLRRAEAGGAKADLWVDSERGRPGARGTRDEPCQSLSQAISLLPDPLPNSVTIRVAGGTYPTTGGQGMPPDRLDLMRRMRPGVEVRILGVAGAGGSPPRLGWEGGASMIHACEGAWWVENVQVGTGSTRQRRGVFVTGPAQVTLKNVTFRTRSQSDAAIHAERGGLVSLRGAIRVNEHLHEKAPDETFAGVVATDHGVVRFAEREGASLDVGNGSLSASYYGVIRLGCQTARITSWGEQSNNLAVNNSGRIDLHNTTTTLCARRKGNTPIGLEHDGHVLAEGARLVVVGENNMAIALQKVSTLTCNDIELRGAFGQSLWAASGSMFVGRFLTDLSDVTADTSARINIERLDGKVLGKVTANRGGTVVLPGRKAVGE